MVIYYLYRYDYILNKRIRDVNESTKWELSTTPNFDDTVYSNDVATMTSQISQHILSSKHMIV